MNEKIVLLTAVSSFGGMTLAAYVRYIGEYSTPRADFSKALKTVREIFKKQPEVKYIRAGAEVGGPDGLDA